MSDFVPTALPSALPVTTLPVNRHGHSLGDILQLAHPDPRRAGAKLVSELRELVLAAPGHRADEWVALPRFARLVVVLDEALAHVTAHGIDGLVEDDASFALLPVAERMCDEIGARQSATYLREARALFDAGSTAEARLDRIEAWEASTNDPLARLDDLHMAAMLAEVPAALRAYVETHRDEVEGELRSAMRADHAASSGRLTD